MKAFLTVVLALIVLALRGVIIPRLGLEAMGIIETFFVMLAIGTCAQELRLGMDMRQYGNKQVAIVPTSRTPQQVFLGRVLEIVTIGCLLVAAGLMFLLWVGGVFDTELIVLGLALDLIVVVALTAIRRGLGGYWGRRR